jgi:signal transduction histidine kinase
MTRLRSVRWRATLAATGIFAIALLLGGVGLVAVVRQTMITNIDTTLQLRADDILALLEGGAVPESVAIVDQEDSLVQIVTGGAVIASSANLIGEPPIVMTPLGGPVDRQTPIGSDEFRVLAVQIPGSESSMLIVGSTLEAVDDTVLATTLFLGLGLPGLLVLVGLSTWTVVGRALRPVEAIRSEVADIGVTDLHRRVPTPATDDEIARLADTMNEMLDRVESGTERQRRFVSDASHELRTPIAVIRNELEVALRQPANAVDWTTIAAEVLDEDLRMQRLVEDLLWLARHDQHRRPDRMVLVDLDEVVAHQLGRLATQEQLVVRGDGIGAGQVRGNADDLTRVVQNLLDNAVRHAATTVSVTVQSTDRSTVVLHVDDDGPGVPVEQRDSVFERFTRSDEARARDDGGAGLGLAIATEIARDHDATLSVGQSPLGGARFSLELADARVSEASRVRTPTSD